MTGCYKVSEYRRLWGHTWVLCRVYTHKGEAVEAKEKCRRKGKIARLQAIREANHTTYLLWRLVK